MAITTPLRTALLPLYLLLTTLLLLTSPTTAHFYLNHPPTIGFDDDLEGQAPCGSFTVDFTKANVTDFHVGGDSIALTSVHPKATWLFRATLDQTATMGNWTALLPAVEQTGLGDFCEKQVTVPEAWAGKKGVIGVVQDAPDGLLYQCAAVNFVVGSNPPPGICSNVTGLSAMYTADAMLSSLPAMATATSTGMDTGMTSAISTASTTGGSGPAPSASAGKSEGQKMVAVGGGLSVMMGMVGLGLVTVFVGVLGVGIAL